MCVVSMVMDHYAPKIPDPNKIHIPYVQPYINPMQPPSEELVELRKILKEFREALKAAKVVDKLTAQPDCEDPEKAKLEERVAILEKKMQQLTEIIKINDIST